MVAFFSYSLLLLATLVLTTSNQPSEQASVANQVRELDLNPWAIAKTAMNYNAFVLQAVLRFARVFPHKCAFVCKATLPTFWPTFHSLTWLEAWQSLTSACPQSCCYLQLPYPQTSDDDSLLQGDRQDPTFAGDASSDAFNFFGADVNLVILSILAFAPMVTCFKQCRQFKYAMPTILRTTKHLWTCPWTPWNVPPLSPSKIPWGFCCSWPWGKVILPNHVPPKMDSLGGTLSSWTFPPSKKLEATGAYPSTVLGRWPPGSPSSMRAWSRTSWMVVGASKGKLVSRTRGTTSHGLG